MSVSVAVVVERELLRLGRRWQTMAARAGFAAVVFGFVAFAYTAQYALADVISVTALAKVGRAIFMTWAGSLFAAVVLITPVIVGQAVIDEKESRTLELLAMTRLTPRRILWGTLLSRLLMIESLMLAATPVLAAVLGFGGVGPLEMLNALVQVNVTMLVVGAVATFLALYARSVIVVALQTWGWLFMANLATGLIAGIGALGGSNFILATPMMALGGVAAQTGVSPWMALIVPPAVWGFVAFAVMHVTVLCFETLALAERDANQLDADVSAGFWALERFRKRLWPVGFALLMTSPVLVAPRIVGAWVPVLPELLVWAWFAGVVALGGVLHLLGVRRTTLKRAKKAQERSLRGTNWRRMTAYFDESDAQARDGTRKGTLLSPMQRRVWDQPVMWREAMTSAHGRIRRVLVVWYVVIALSVGAMAVAWGPSEREAPLVIGLMILMTVPPLTLLLATSSVVGERVAGTLELLCVTPMSGRRILQGKLGALAVLLGPGTALGALLMLGGASGAGGLAVLDVAAGLLWFGVINLVIALLCMWRAMAVKTPSRAWATNLVLVFGVTWVFAGITGLLSMIKPLMGAWAIVVPFGITAVDHDLLFATLLASSAFWALVASVLGLGASRSLAKRAAGA